MIRWITVSNPKHRLIHHEDIVGTMMMWCYGLWDEDIIISYHCGRERGFQNLYTLKGGVSNYLKDEGSKQWVGNLFVFDSRLSLPPSAYNPEAESCSTPQFSENNAFARCYICSSQVSQLRHRNCANLDCNLLFL